MATKIAEVYAEITARNGKLATKLKESQEMVRGFSSRVKRHLKATASSIGSSFKKMASTMATQMATGMAAFALLQKGIDRFKLAIADAIKLEGLEIAFKNLAGGAQNATAMMNEMNHAFRGTVDQVTMLEQANTALLLGVARNANEMAFLATAARQLGKAVGKDAAFGFKSLTVGIGRQSKLWLDNLGIMVDTTKAYEDFAVILGKTALELTDVERKQAFMNATMAATRDRLQKLGDDVETAGEKFARFKTTWSGIFTAIGKGIVFLGREFFNTVTRFTRAMMELASPGYFAAIEEARELERTNLEHQIRNEKALAKEKENRLRIEGQFKKMREEEKEELKRVKKVEEEIAKEEESRGQLMQRLVLEELRALDKTTEAALKAAEFEFQNTMKQLEKMHGVWDLEAQLLATFEAKKAAIKKAAREKELQEELRELSAHEARRNKIRELGAEQERRTQIAAAREEAEEIEGIHKRVRARGIEQEEAIAARAAGVVARERPAPRAQFMGLEEVWRRAQTAVTVDPGVDATKTQTVILSEKIDVTNELLRENIRVTQGDEE